MAGDRREGISSGTRLAAALVTIGLVLALVALRFRVFTPASTCPATSAVDTR